MTGTPRFYPSLICPPLSDPNVAPTAHHPHPRSIPIQFRPYLGWSNYKDYTNYQRVQIEVCVSFIQKNIGNIAATLLWQISLKQSFAQHAHRQHSKILRSRPELCRYSARQSATLYDREDHTICIDVFLWNQLSEIIRQRKRSCDTSFLALLGPLQITKHADTLRSSRQCSSIVPHTGSFPSALRV